MKRFANKILITIAGLVMCGFGGYFIYLGLFVDKTLLYRILDIFNGLGFVLIGVVTIYYLSLEE